MDATGTDSGKGAVLPRLERWHEVRDDGNRDAAIELERKIVGSLSAPDDGTGEARAAIGKVFAKALAAGGEEGAHRVLNKARDQLEQAVRALEGSGGLNEGDEDDEFVPASHVDGDAPVPLLSLAGKQGYLLCEGAIAIVSGAGGIAKSSFARQVALGFAMAADESGRTSLRGGILDAPSGGGRVVYMSFEDPARLVRQGLEELARQTDDEGQNAALDAVDRVFLKRKGRCRAVFGPTDREGGSGLYNAQPGPLPGWRVMGRAVERARPRLLVLDPVLSAFSGDSNGAAPVREFLEALTCFAEQYCLGVLLVAHSNKAVRRGKVDLMDPGQVGGSGHWYDTVRGVLVLNRDERDPQARVLACPKSNRGPDRLFMSLHGIFGDEGGYLGFSPADSRGWSYASALEKQKSKPANGDGRRANGSGVGQYARGVA